MFFILSEAILRPTGRRFDRASHSASSGKTAFAFFRRWICVSIRRFGLSLDAEACPGARFVTFTVESPGGLSPYHPLEQPVKLAHSSNLLDFLA